MRTLTTMLYVAVSVSVGWALLQSRKIVRKFQTAEERRSARLNLLVVCIFVLVVSGAAVILRLS